VPHTYVIKYVCSTYPPVISIIKYFSVNKISAVLKIHSKTRSEDILNNTEAKCSCLVLPVFLQVDITTPKNVSNGGCRDE
jgi:hypothetical protein